MRAEYRQTALLVALTEAGTHLHQQLSAEGVVVIVGEDLRELSEGAETLPVNRHRVQQEVNKHVPLFHLQVHATTLCVCRVWKHTVTPPPRSSSAGGWRCTEGQRGWLATRRSSSRSDIPEHDVTRKTEVIQPQMLSEETEGILQI